MTVQGGGLRVLLGPELDARHVAHADETRRRAHFIPGHRLHEDRAKLLRRREPAQGVERELHVLAAGGRLPADRTGRDLHVLVADRINHLLGRQVERREPFGVEPDAHAVVALAEQADVANAFDSGQLILDVDRRVVAQVEVVVSAFGRDEVDAQEDVRRLLLDAHPLLSHRLRELGERQRHAILHEHKRGVQVGPQVERQRERVRAVVARLRRHVEHVFHAIDLLLDGRGHGIGDDLGIGAHVAA